MKIIKTFLCTKHDLMCPVICHIVYGYPIAKLMLVKCIQSLI